MAYESSRMRWSARLALAVPAVLSLVLASSAQAAPPVPLGTADGFAVLAGSTITNTGPTLISGNLGLHPGTAVAGFPPGTVNGAKHVERCCRPAGRDRPDDRVQRRRRTAVLRGVAARRRRADAHRRRLHERAGRLARADRAPDARRAGRPARGVHLPDPVDARDGDRQQRQARQRRPGVQRLLAGGQLRHARDEDRVPGQHPGADVDLGERRRDRERQAPGPQRRRDADRRHGDAIAVCGRHGAPARTPVRTPGPGTTPALPALDVRLSKPAVIGRETSLVIETKDSARAGQRDERAVRRRTRRVRQQRVPAP